MGGIFRQCWTNLIFSIIIQQTCNIIWECLQKFKYSSLHRIVFEQVLPLQMVFGRINENQGLNLIAIDLTTEVKENLLYSVNLIHPTSMFTKCRCKSPTVTNGEAFKISTNLSRPYPFGGLDPCKRVFNYTLTKYQCTIENAFKIYVNKWQIFHCLFSYNWISLMK